jgi:hypothetical protein
MRLGLVALALTASLTGCGLYKPHYQTESIQFFRPDCKNEAAQIRYLTKLKDFPSQGDVSENKYNTTIDIQIERLKFYCAQNEN